MSNLTYISKKIFKIVMGVIVFLCVGLMLNTDIFAISNEILEQKWGYDAYVKIKSTGGVFACFGDLNGQAMRYVCGKKYAYNTDTPKYTLDKYGNCKETVTSTISFATNAPNINTGENDCEYQVYLSSDSAGNSKWESEGDMDLKIYNYKISIKNIVMERADNGAISYKEIDDKDVKFGGQTWKTSTKYYITKKKNPQLGLARKGSISLPEQYEGRGFRGYSTSSKCTNLFPDDQVVTLTSGAQTFYACWDATYHYEITLGNVYGQISNSEWDNQTRVINGLKYGIRLTLPKDSEFIYDNKTLVGKIAGYADSMDDCNTKDYLITMKEILEGKTVPVSPGKTSFVVCYEDPNDAKCKSITTKKECEKLSDTCRWYDSQMTNNINNLFSCNPKSSPVDYEPGASKSFDINFHFNGGQLKDGSSGTTTKKTLKCNHKECKVSSDKIPDVIRNGYAFMGWKKGSSDCEDNKVYPMLYENGNQFDNLASETNFYACWKKSSNDSGSTSKAFKVTFDGNGGKTSNGKTSLSFSCNEKCTSFSGVGDFTRNGYSFRGWSTSNSCTNVVNSVTPSSVTSAKTYYACWNKNTSQTAQTTSTNTLTFSQSWGTGFTCESGYTQSSGGGLCMKTVSTGTTVKLPSTSSYDPYNDNNKFIGWTKVLDINDSSKTVCTTNLLVKPGTSVKISSNTLYYACYREDINGYRYTFEGASADGQEVPCGATLSITNCVIGSDNIEYCFYNKIGNKSISGKVYKNKLATTDTTSSCKTTESQEKPETNIVTINDYMYATISAIRDVKLECGSKVYITTCNGNICNFTSYVTTDGQTKNVNGTVNKDYLKTTQKAALEDTKNCPKVEVDKNENTLVQTECNNKPYKNVKGSMTINMCYNKNYDDEKVRNMILDTNLVVCGNGYEYDKTAVRASGSAICNDIVCVRNYTISCNQVAVEGSVSLSTTPVIAGSNGKGIVKIKANSTRGRIVGYYLSEILSAPTATSEWIQINTSNFEVESTPGVQYIWVKDSDGVISNVSTVLVIDKNNNKNTLKTLQLSDGSNNSIVPNGVSYVASSGNGYAMLSNSINQKSLITKGFDQFTSEYKIDVDSPTLSVYATLTSSDASYVDGYGPRTVNLTYGVNTVLIKIQDNEGKIRTYTIIANRKDNRTSDNTLSNITVGVGQIEFNSNVTEYKIEIPAETTEVDVSAVIGSEYATYVEGYEPGKVLITGDTTVKLIKVESQTGSTRTYVLSFIKEKTDTISKESLQLFGLTIPGVYIPFESEVSNYSISVDYATEIIDIYTPLKDDDSSVSIRVRKPNSVDYIDVSGIGVGLDVGDNYVEIKVTDSESYESYYRLTIIRKEYGLDISNDTSLKDLKVLGYDIKFDPKDKEYSVRVKKEKSLVITAVPNSNRAEVFIRGNNELTGFSTVRIKVVAENGEYETYSVDIKKDAFNETIEKIAIVVGGVIILVTSGIIIMKKKYKNKKDYYRE